MARIGRLKVIGEDAFYHIISHTVSQDFLLHDQEKQKRFDIIKRYSALFFVKVIGYVFLPVQGYPGSRDLPDLGFLTPVYLLFLQPRIPALHHFCFVFSPPFSIYHNLF
jgi:hypothetical protein